MPIPSKTKSLKAKYYLIPAAACLIAMGVLCYYYFMMPFLASAEKQYVYIDEDDTPDSLYAKLEPIGSAHAVTAFRTLMRHSGADSRLRTGRYALEPSMTAIDVFRHLRNGQQEPIRLTIPEVRTMPQLAARLAQKLMLDSATIASSLTGDTLACLFVPNTYEVYWNVGIDAFIARMRREHDAFWNANRRAKAHNVGLTPNEVCTLASIIDEETANEAEKPMVAAMYLNRLRIGMPLQADPTVKFALGDFTLRRIYNTHLEVESPYNTYKYPGLPPGPIKIASVKGIDAVLNPANHDYLYMCAKEDFSGTHNFARTYSEHLLNAARYARALNQRGIR
ncbi:MAG: endolytic transglycosylase MltG [Prevotella sp.]|nr:endolytic transglycosylase MltG [Prevotella sp.]